MQIDAYNTTFGKPYRVANKVEATIQALHISQSLTPTKKDGVFVITHENKLPIEVFAFPLTFQAYNRKMITVYDERPYRNESNNQVTNSNEMTVMKLTAFLQQDVATGNLTPLKQARNVATKAFADSLGSLIINRGNLGSSSMIGRNPMASEEALTLKVLLAYYFIGLEEPVNSDLELVTVNVVREIFGTDKGFVLGVIEDLGRLPTMVELHKAIIENPTLYKLKTVSFKDFLHLVSGFTFAALGRHVVGAATEAPCLFTAFVYGAIVFKGYNKTPLGLALDPKYNKDILKTFELKIDYTYDLNG
jgi:hypothetical protein